MHTVINLYLDNLQSLIKNIDLDALNKALTLLKQARDNRKHIFIAGNGGSAATAAHWSNDLGKGTKRSGRPPLKVISLASNISWMTALGNDEGYDRIFTGQMENFAETGDLLIVISASGNSPNLIDAVSYSKKHGVTTIGMLGFDGGKLKDQVDHVLLAETEKGHYELVEDLHSILCHTLTVSLCADKKEA